jgi:hypothetical protein
MTLVDHPYLKTGFVYIPKPFNKMNSHTQHNSITTVTLRDLTSLDHSNPYIARALEEDYQTFDSILPMRYIHSWQHLNRGRYAELALFAGSIECTDPRTGTVIQSRRAWVLHDVWVGIAYEFQGLDKFFLITSSFDQAKLGLWFPDASLFVAGNVDSNWVQIGLQLVRGLMDHMDGAQSWHPVPESKDHRTCVLYAGFCNNLGHFMWQDLSGLEAVSQAGGFSRVHTLVVGPSEFFPVDKIFPEIMEAGVRIERQQKPLIPCVLHSNFLPLRVSGNQISTSLRSRIVGWALQTCGESLNNLLKYNDDSLNLWFNLRLHNKSWANQSDGLQAIALAFKSRLAQTRPVRIFLDGTPDTSQLAIDLAKRLEGIAEVVNATSVSLNQSIALSSLIDLHACVIGSGLTLPHWIMGRRGVAHSNRAHMGQRSFWNSVSEGAHDVVFVPDNSIQDHNGPSSPDSSYVNYDLDWKALLYELSNLHQFYDYRRRQSAVNQMVSLSGKCEWVRAAERVIFI